MNRKLATLVSLVAGSALALSLAGPALATEPGAPPADSTQSQAFAAWAAPGTVEADHVTRPVSTTSASTASSSQPTAGMRLTHKHGGPMLWTENILEWYWNKSKITSSNGTQDFGFLFPNTASKGGIVRTLKTNSQHDWRGTMIVGVGVVTPWGNVDISKTSKTDYYELVRGGDDYINP